MKDKECEYIFLPHSSWPYIIVRNSVSESIFININFNSRSGELFVHFYSVLGEGRRYKPSKGGNILGRALVPAPSIRGSDLKDSESNLI